MTLEEDAQVIAGVLAAGFRSDNDGTAALMGALDKDVRRILAALAEIDRTLLQSLASTRSIDTGELVDYLVSSLEATRLDRLAGTRPSWPQEAWVAATIAVRLVGAAISTPATTVLRKPADVEPQAWLTGWYIVAWAITIELAEDAGRTPEEMAQNTALNYAHWASE